MTFRGDKSRRAAILAIDLVLVVLALPLALALRLGADVLVEQTDLIADAFIVYVPVAALLLLVFRLDRIPWRYASLSDAVRIAEFAALLNLVFLAALFLVTRLDAFPRSTIIINTLLVALFVMAVRMWLRLYHERRLTGFMETGFRGASKNADPVLLIGADDAADAYIRQLRRDPDARYRAVGALTRRPASVGTRLHGVPVRGTYNDLERTVERLARQDLKPKLLIIAAPNVEGATVRSLLTRAQALGIPLKRLPRHTELLRAGGRLSIEPLDLEDLLARPEIQLDRDLAEAQIRDRVVLVTGAGGSIGSELARQLAALEPARLVLADSSEFNLFSIDNEISNAMPSLQRVCHLVDVRDRERILAMVEHESPDFVFHAAALKHVPLIEDHPDEAVRTNVLGTQNVADAAVASGASTFVMISTDKATWPVSVMGATKRIAEAYCQSLDLERGPEGGTRMVTVRFGNVLGSRGSVVPLFQEQIARGGPITITDKDATRFFMTIREASQLVVQASVMDDLTSEAGSIVVLNMGEPVRIVDLARNMVRLSGLEPDRDIGFHYVGLRPGERLREELFTDEEELIASSHRDLMIARPSTADRALIERYILSLARAAGVHDKVETRRLLARYLHTPDSAGRPVAAEG